MTGKPTFEELEHRVLEKSEYERKRVEEALRQSEHRFRDLLSRLPIGVYRNTPGRSGRFIVANEAIARMFGFDSTEAFLRTHVSDLYMDPAERAAFSSRLLSRGGVDAVTLRLRKKDGSSFWGSVTVVRNADGEIEYFDGIIEDISVRRQAEEALRESEEKYRSLFNQFVAGIYLHDLEGRIFDVNQAACMQSGYSREELLEMEVFDLHPDSAETSHRPKTEILRQWNQWQPGQRFRLEAEHRRKDGTIFPIELSTAVIQYGGQNVILAIIQDITERRQAEEALRRSENKYRTLFEKSADAIFIVDKPTGRYLEANKAGEKLTGRSVSELRKLTTREVTPGGAAQRLRYVDSMSGTTEMGEVTYFQPDGTERIARLTSVPLDDNTVYGIAQDITDNKRAEDAVRLERDRAQMYLDTVEAIIIALDREGRITLTNKKGCRILGCDERDIIGKNWFAKFLPQPDGMKKVYPVFLNLIQGKMEGQEYFENPIITNNGELRHIAWHNALLRDKRGRIIGTLSAGEDITEKKQLEEQMQKAQKMESIGNLAGGVAHDFNNLLFPIIGLSELLLKDLPQNSLEHEKVREILKAGQRGTDLVKQILAFSRQSENKKIPVRIQEVLKDVFKLSRSTIPSNIEIQQEIQDKCGQVEADPSQLHQIAMNLITNAYHAVEEAGGKIVVKLRETDILKDDTAGSALAPGRYAMLTVSDTGAGIDPAIIDKIFEPYFTTKKKDKGTGLGLAVVYGIARYLGGDIKVSSAPGKQTTFSVYIPLMARSPQAAVSETVEIPETGTGRILLVDDEQEIVDLENMMLERLGYQVTSFTRSGEALEAFRESADAFDLVITDMTMPNMTGDVLAKELLSIRPGIPIILCTGFSEQIDGEKAKSIGIKGFLMKPITLAALGKTVRNALGEHQEPGNME